MNIPKAHDNTVTQSFLGGYYYASDLCQDYPRIDDILTGALELKTAGDTSTRALSRQVLFRILQWCSTVDVASINTATNGTYSYRALASYAALARVASKAIETFIGTLPEAVKKASTKNQRQALDAPYAQQLQALGL